MSSDFSDRIKNIFGGTTHHPQVPYLDFNESRPVAVRKSMCQAPFNSIRFEQRGIARTCCYNREVVLGVYPKQSISEIWNGEAAEQIRQSSRNFDFSNGCQLCEKQLKNEEFDTVKIRQYDDLPIGNAKYPTMLDFSIHNTCNLECVMCYGEFSSSIRKNREKLPVVPMVYDATFVRQLEEFIPHAKQFVFAGGEPFLIELYYDIWERINAINPTDVHIVTNGTILNNRVKQILEHGRYHITHSLESLNKAKYEQIRKNADFDRMRSNMDYFMQYCKEQGTEYAINVCPLQQNWRDLPDLVAFCTDNQIKIYILTVVYPPSATLQTLAIGELERIQNYYSQFSFPESSIVEKHNASNFRDLCSRVKAYLRQAIEKQNGTEATSNSDELKHDISVFFDLMIERLEKYHTTQADMGADDMELMRQQIFKLNATYQGHQISGGKIKELKNASDEMIIAAINGMSEEDFSLVIRDHVL